MTKQTKRKGFTAIEMLVVIAIIAGLTAIVIPVVGNQTIKSKAAVNAANMRTVETTISLKMADNPEDFDEFFKTGKELEETSDGVLGKLYDIVFGEGEGEARRIKYNVLIGDDKSPIQIPGSDLVISGLTGAKGLEAPGRNGSPDLVIAEGTPMAAYITEEGVVVFYGNYTKEDFADVAEDGYYDGMVTGGGGDSGNDGFLGDIQDAIDEAVCRKEAGSGLIVKGEGKHKPGADCVCPYCGGEAHWRADKTIDRTLVGNLITYNTSTKYHKCTCGHVFNPTCRFENGVHECVYLDCEESKCVDVDPNNSRDKSDHKCYLCGERNENWCYDYVNSKRGNTPDHKCDLCGTTVSKCGDEGYTKDPLQHQCNICKVKSNHTYGNGSTCVCGYSKPTCAYTSNGVRCTNTEIVEKDGDNGYCNDHKRKSCTARVPAAIGLFTDTYGCDGKYRGTIEDCSNVANHVKCGVCKTHAVENNGYCSAHQEKTCKEDVLKEGGGTKDCNTKYRETCGNVENHHTTHTYKNTGDAAQHHCACGAAQKHTYDDKTGKCACGATKTKCKFNGTGGCNSFEVDSEGYCSAHQNKPCGICGANYRGTSCEATHGTCPVVVNGTKCTAETANNNTKCSNHKDYAMCSKCGKWYTGLDLDGKCSDCSGCVTPDTLVTLANGSLKRIDEVTTNDYLLVWDFYQGKTAAVPAAIIFDHGYGYNTVIALHFSDGTTVKVVNLHQFYDADLNTLVTIDAHSAQQYVGHRFAKQGGKTVELVGYTISQEYVEAFGIISAVHYNIYVEGMLSADFMPEDYDLFNYFAFGTDMKFDQAQMQSDIEQYGLYTYEEFADYLTYEQFIGFNVPYMKVAVGKGNYTYEGILNLINQYLGQ